FRETDRCFVKLVSERHNSAFRDQNGWNKFDLRQGPVLTGIDYIAVVPRRRFTRESHPPSERTARPRGNVAFPRERASFKRSCRCTASASAGLTIGIVAVARFAATAGPLAGARITLG